MDFISRDVKSTISLGSFVILIFFVIFSPKIPVFLNIVKIYRKILRKDETPEKKQLKEERKKKKQEQESLDSEGDSTIVADNDENPFASGGAAQIQHNNQKTKKKEFIYESENVASGTKFMRETKKKIDHLWGIWEDVTSYLLWISIDFSKGPLIVMIILFLTTILPYPVLVEGIVGNTNIRPYSVMLLFFSLSYICLSLDTTGIFSFIAKQIVEKTRKSGKLLFFGLSAFTSILTVFTSNDIVILTVTPIICYMSIHINKFLDEKHKRTGEKVKHFDPIPFLISQFFLANVWSIALEIGNPTNIIVAEAYHINFAQFTMWMGIPALFAGSSYFVLLFCLFFTRIPSSMPKITENEGEESKVEEKKTARNIPKSVNSSKYEDQQGESETPSEDMNTSYKSSSKSKSLEKIASGNDFKAKFVQFLPKFYKYFLIFEASLKTFGLFACLLVLAISSIFQIPSFLVTLLFFSFFFVFDVIRDIIFTIIMIVLRLMEKLEDRANGFDTQDLISFFLKKILLNMITESTSLKAIYRMPWAVLPFALSMFIMVELLRYYSWIDNFATIFTRVMSFLAGRGTDLPQPDRSTISFLQIVKDSFVNIFFMMYASSFACNILNNQPMSILFTSMTQSQPFQVFFSATTDNVKLGTLFSLIAGSNLGANITLIGALAGIMWITILKNNGVKGMGFFKFLMYGLIITPIVCTITALVITLEVIVVEAFQSFTQKK